MFAFMAPRPAARGALIPFFVISFGILAVLAPAGAAQAAGCSFAPQGEGRVAEIVDGRSFRLTDGREIRLAGIEATPSDLDATNKAGALTALLAGRDVALRGEDDAPDRHGRQTAFVFLAPSDVPIQSLLLAEGEALVNAEVADKECAAVLMKAEAEVRQTKKDLESFYGHKKRGNFRRYFDQGWAICGSRGQGFVRKTSWGNDLPEFRAELDTGLRCDYFKARNTGD